MTKIMIAITTYNRKEIIEISSRSLYEIDGIVNGDVYVFDDCSTEFDSKYLEEMYPGAHIIESKKNLGADKNIERAYKYFLKSDYDYFFNADSDLIFNKKILFKINDIISKFCKKNSILFSVFNTENHLTIGECDDLLIKKNVGAGGCVFNKAAISQFIKKLPKKYDYKNLSVDHVFCDIYNSNGNNIFCTKCSLVQHIGIEGQNSCDFLFDWGKNFEVDSLTNAKAIIEIYEKNISVEKNGVESRLIDYAQKGKFGISLSLKLLLITLKNKIFKFRSKK